MIGRVHIWRAPIGLSPRGQMVVSCRHTAHRQDTRTLMDSEQRLGLLFVTLSTLGYAFLPIIGREIYNVSDLLPTDVAFWRFVVATPVIWIMIQTRPTLRQVEHESRLQTIKLLLMGTLYSLSALGAFAALQTIDANTFTVLFFTYPAMVAIIGFFLGVKLQRVAWMAIAMTLVGIYLTVPDLSWNTGDGVLVGVGIALLTALAVAVYYQFIQTIMRDTKSTIRGTAWIITGTLISLALVVPFFGLTSPPSLRAWLLLLALGTISSAFPIFLVNLAVKRLGATRTAIISSSQPVFTLILAPLFLNETSAPIQWLGAGFIIAAVISLELRPRRKPAT
jgi:drug/metabolite transporter (DMT)-like permease